MNDIDSLIAALADGDQESRNNASRLLQESYETYADRLIAELQNPNFEIRRAVVLILSNHNEPHVADALLLALEDVDSRVRIGAMLNLTKIKDQRAINPLIHIFQHDSDSIVRGSAAEALGELGDPGAIGPLTEALSIPGKGSKLNIALALAKINAIEPLVAALINGNPLLRSIVAIALGRLKNPCAISPLLATINSDNDRNVRCNAIAALCEINDPVVIEPILHSMLNDVDPGVRWAAAGHLTRYFNDSRITDALLALLDDPHPIVHDTVICALGNTGDSRVIGPLIRILEGPDVEVDIELAKQSDDTLSINLQAYKYAYRMSAASSLGRLGGDAAISTLITALADKVPDVRSAAINALKKMNDPRAAEALRQYTK